MPSTLPVGQAMQQQVQARHATTPPLQAVREGGSQHLGYHRLLDQLDFVLFQGIQGRGHGQSLALAS